MHIDQLLILGAGGHARVVMDAARSHPDPIELFLYDENIFLQDKLIDGICVHTPAKELLCQPAHVHIAIGNNQIRQQLAEQIMQKKRQLHTIMHRAAIISPYCEIKAGCFIAAQAIVAPGAFLGNAVIVNHAAIVDHDCHIGSWTHIAPNVTLGGNVTIGERCLIGAGAIILPGVKVGANVRVGAGSVVTKNIAAGQTVIGIPAISIT